MTTNWRPISEAPRDGTWIFAYWGSDTNPGHRSYGVTAFIDGEWRNPDDPVDWYGEPTHWMPLPPPPGAPK